MKRDPVCGHAVDEMKSVYYSDIDVRRFHFCCETCRNSFEEDPEAYIGRNWWQRFLNRLADSNVQSFGNKKPSCH